MAAPTRRRHRWRKRLGTLARFVAALALVGGVYTAFAPGIYADETEQSLTQLAEEGKELFDTSCVTCHGPTAAGVEGRGPSLIGIGSAAVEFQVNSGRMPMARQEAQAVRKDAVFTPAEAAAIAAYIQTLGGGPESPDKATLAQMMSEADIADGGALFRVNCSSCHGFGTGGGALSSGKFAPALGGVPTMEIYQAMLTGPQNMPVFGDNQLTPDEKAAVIAYIEYVNSDKDPGGWGLGRFGPSTEALAIFLVGVASLAVATLWIAGKS